MSSDFSESYRHGEFVVHVKEYDVTTKTGKTYHVKEYWRRPTAKESRYSYTLYVVKRPKHKDLPEAKAVDIDIWTKKKLDKDDLQNEAMAWIKDNAPEYYLSNNWLDYERFEKTKISRIDAENLGLDDKEPHISIEPLPEGLPSPDLQGQVSHVEMPKEPVRDEDRIVLDL